MTTLSVSDLENVLREVAQLSGVRLSQPYINVAPNMVHLEGAITIHGAIHYWETDIDLRDLKARDDIATLIESLLQSFEKAARGAVTR